MRFSNEFSRFELEIGSYQFPISDEKYDSNWLVVNGTVEHAGEQWTFQDPCLLTWEAEEIVAWLEALSSGRQAQADLSFVEPNISFRWLSDNMLCVMLWLEALPPSKRSSTELGEELSIQFSVTPASLHQAAQEFRTQLVRFPQRKAGSAL
jgi:hypothetical protein